MSRVLSNLEKKKAPLPLAYVGSPCLSPRRGEVSRSDGEGPLFGNDVDHWSALRWTIMLPERIRRNMRNARAKGAKICRPQTTLDDIPANFLRHHPQYKNGAFNLTELARLCDISRTTAYKYIGLLEA